MRDSTVLIVGASARSAAFSALRAGLRPWCVDLFADADLGAVAPVTRVAAARYPEAFVEVMGGAPPGPWLYTGALENRPALVRRLAKRRPLWGNDAGVLKRIRSPFQVAAVLLQHQLACPAVWPDPGQIPDDCAALLKPRCSAGGSGVRPFAKGQRPRRIEGVYFQEYVQGEACAAIYLAGRHDCNLLGVTRQLVGLDWLHARPFHYCGNIGPLVLDEELHLRFEKIGSILATSFALRGLFGVDCVLREGVPWPVEVNPRYTASVEVLENALGIKALLWHRQAFEGEQPGPGLSHHPRLPTHVGKAILFAREPVVFPADGPWQPVLRKLAADANPFEFPAFADIPQAGELIPARRPILTFFATGTSSENCHQTLRGIARDLDRWLFKR